MTAYLDVVSQIVVGQIGPRDVVDRGEASGCLGVFNDGLQCVGGKGLIFYIAGCPPCVQGALYTAR